MLHCFITKNDLKDIMQQKSLYKQLTPLTKQKRKGVFEGLSDGAIGLLTLVIVVAIGALILDGFQNSTSNGTQAYTIIGQGLTGLSTFGNFFNLIVITIVGVAVLILVLAGIGRVRGGATVKGF